MKNKEFLTKKGEEKLIKVVLFLIIALTIITMSSIIGIAQEQSLGTFIQGSCIELKQIANASYCNVTSVNYPNSSKAVSSLMMTKSGSEFNYTSFCETSLLGKYIVNGECDGEGWAYHFNITTTGDNGNIIPIFLLIGGIIIFIIALVSKNPVIGIFSGIIFILAGIFIMVYGLGGTIVNDYSRGIAFISLGLGFVIGFVSIIELAED